jgi:Diacylglycerol kinase catalytic domain
MVTLAAGGVLLLIGIVVHLAAVLLAFIALLVWATGGWYAVSRRGAVRVIALAVALAALAALGVGLAFADISVWRAVVVLILGGVSVLAARYALKRTRRQLRARLTRLAVAEPPAHPVLIMNPKSGGGKAERFGLAEQCWERGIEPVVLRPGDDLLQLAENAIARGADAIGMAGGDGSQALVASVAAARCPARVRAHGDAQPFRA